MYRESTNLRTKRNNNYIQPKSLLKNVADVQPKSTSQERRSKSVRRSLHNEKIPSRDDSKMFYKIPLKESATKTQKKVYNKKGKISNSKDIYDEETPEKQLPSNKSKSFRQINKIFKEISNRSNKKIDIDILGNNSNDVINNLGDSYKDLMETDINNKIRKKIWIEEEDEIIFKWVKKNGAKKWRHVGALIPGRNAKQCRERWHNHLDPTINHTEWNDKEDWVLFLCHELHGPKWATILSYIPGRTDNSIKNRWNSHIVKRLHHLNNYLKNLKASYIKSETTNDLSSIEVHLIKELIEKDKKFYKSIVEFSKDKTFQNKNLSKLDIIKNFDISTYQKACDKNINSESNNERIVFSGPLEQDLIKNDMKKNAMLEECLTFQGPATKEKDLCKNDNALVSNTNIVKETKNFVFGSASFSDHSNSAGNNQMESNMSFGFRNKLKNNMADDSSILGRTINKNAFQENDGFQLKRFAFTDEKQPNRNPFTIPEQSMQNLPSDNKTFKKDFNYLGEPTKKLKTDSFVNTNSNNNPLVMNKNTEKDIFAKIAYNKAHNLSFNNNEQIQPNSRLLTNNMTHTNMSDPKASNNIKRQRNSFHSQQDFNNFNRISPSQNYEEEYTRKNSNKNVEDVKKAKFFDNDEQFYKKQSFDEVNPNNEMLYENF